jgi:hypothetical protein
MPKYVISSTLEDPGWNNSIVLQGDGVNKVAKLKQEIDGDIIVPGSTPSLDARVARDVRLLASTAAPPSGCSNLLGGTRPPLVARSRSRVVHGLSTSLCFLHGPFDARRNAGD